MFIRVLLCVNTLFIICTCLSISTRYSLMPCQYDKDCIKDAFCKDNEYCTCKQGYVPDRNMSACLQEARRIGDPCVKNIQCTAAFGLKAECYRKIPDGPGKCQCTADAHFEDTICYPSVGLGKSCHASAECSVKSNISVYCDTGICVCPFYYHPNADGTDCLASSNIGDVCRNNSDCTTPNSNCLNICRCRRDFIVSQDGKRCLEVASSLGTRCEEDIQCQAKLRNSVCDRATKRCQCSNSSHHRDGSCWNIAGLGESCSDTRECVVPTHFKSAVKCSGDKICTCSEGFKENSYRNDCLKGLSPALYEKYSIGIILVASNLFLFYSH